MIWDSWIWRRSNGVYIRKTYSAITHSHTNILFLFLVFFLFLFYSLWVSKQQRLSSHKRHPINQNSSNKKKQLKTTPLRVYSDHGLLVPPIVQIQTGLSLTSSYSRSEYRHSYPCFAFLKSSIFVDQGFFFFFCESWICLDTLKMQTFKGCQRESCIRSAKWWLFVSISYWPNSALGFLCSMDYYCGSVGCVEVWVLSVGNGGLLGFENWVTAWFFFFFFWSLCVCEWVGLSVLEILYV